MARRFKTATLLNLAGLAVAFAALFLFLTQVNYSASYNRGIPHAERVMRVEAMMNGAHWNTNCSVPLLEMMRKMPEVESGTILTLGGNKTEFFSTSVECDWAKVQKETALEPFGAVCLDGKLNWKDGPDQGAIIPASLAQRFLGTTMAAGQYIWAGKDSLQVIGVYQDFPDNCCVDNIIYVSLGEEGLHDYSEWSYRGYLRLHETADVEAFRKEFADKVRTLFRATILAENIEEYNNSTPEERAAIDQQLDSMIGQHNFRATPLTETYFSGTDSGDRGNRTVHLILIWACILVVLVAAINFLNFTLAESPMRVKGVNTRRVLGSSLTSLRMGLIGETVVIALLAFLLGMFIVYLLTQWTAITSLVQGSIELQDHLPLLGLTALVALAIGVVAGAYPAWFVTSFQPAMALKGAFGLTPRGRRLRTLLVSLQITISLVLATYIGILMLQSRYIYHSDYGFDKDELCYATLTMDMLNKKDAIRTELLGMGGVEDVSYSAFALGSSAGYMGWGRAQGGKSVSFTSMPVDWHYLSTMGIKVVEGRDFNEHDSDCYIINEAARKRWTWVEMDKELIEGDLPVIGVCENVRYASIRQDRETDPVAFVILGERYADWGDRLCVLNVRLAPQTDKRALRRQIQDKLKGMLDGNELEVHFLDEQLERLYQDEFRFIRQVILFGIICLIITLIGVFCLTMFETEYRRKEIGIRKVFGSTEGQIVRLLTSRYAQLLLIAFVIAVPLAWYMGSQWLENFTERTTIHWWLFPLALLLVGLVTLLTAAFQGWRAANENPINSVKTE
jgi:putative ABC transport system permease protein